MLYYAYHTNLIIGNFSESVFTLVKMLTSIFAFPCDRREILCGSKTKFSIFQVQITSVVCTFFIWRSESYEKSPLLLKKNCLIFYHIIFFSLCQVFLCYFFFVSSKRSPNFTKCDAETSPMSTLPFLHPMLHNNSSSQ